MRQATGSVWLARFSRNIRCFFRIINIRNHPPALRSQLCAKASTACFY